MQRKNNRRRKLVSLILALTLCVSVPGLSFPAHAAPDPSASETIEAETETDAIDEELDEDLDEDADDETEIDETADDAPSLAEQLAAAPPDNFLTLAYLTLCSYANYCVGLDDYFTGDDAVMLDVDYDGKLSPNDAYIMLVWYARFQVDGVFPDDAQTYFDTYVNDAAETTAETTVTTTAPAEDTQDGEESSVTTAETAAETTAAVTTTTTTEASTEASTTTTTTATTTSTVTTTAVITSSKQHYEGIDVSKWQGDIDWSAVAADGCEFAIVRAGYGTHSSSIEPYFETNVEGAHENGIMVGAYWYCTAMTASAATQQAQIFLDTIAGYQFEYPVVLDIEEADQMALSTSTLDSIITAFCSTMEDAGYYVAIYSSKSYLENNFSYDVLKNYDVWVAHWTYDYAVPTSYSRTSFGLWQYTDLGVVPGITGDVDLDLAYKDYETIMRKNGLNGF